MFEGRRKLKADETMCKCEEEAEKEEARVRTPCVPLYFTFHYFMLAASF